MHGRTAVTAQLERGVIDALVALNANFDVMECDPDLADTTAFCAHYRIPLERSANAIMLASKRPAGVNVVCLVLATHRLDVNGTGRREMGVKKVSFAPPELTAELTGMMMGGVTPFGLPDDIPVLVDAAVMDQVWVVVGGGSRSLKIKVDPEVFSRMPNVRVIDGLATAIE
jgi:prolyl-tRNA editing enzyme YbaK/EbsC (Cys-tRNA(Pro) deacylase)